LFTVKSAADQSTDDAVLVRRPTQSLPGGNDDQTVCYALLRQELRDLQLNLRNQTRLLADLLGTEDLTVIAAENI
jgi:hypothetical protein